MRTVVFLLASHGLAGDPWFYWVIRALNAHPEIYAYFGESTRSKYFHERSRKERPDVIEFVKWLRDVGSQFKAVGDCYAYRSYQLEVLWDVYGDEVRWVNLVRHPFCWLGYYTDWRAIYNVGAPPENTSALEHEWSVTCHDEIRKYGLPPYTYEDVHIWAFYQGLIILNRMISDGRPGVRNIRVEELISNRSAFVELVKYLTHGEIDYPEELLETIYSWVFKPSREDIIIRADPISEYLNWPDWKKEAFAKIVKPEALETFKKHGYSFEVAGL